ncbi:hypothetical protein [Kurthia massiliensis]|uniref:hypothetical protein n=1 Tax=Kurthia massiliensis TaxID=1033739 RepID=UPI00028995F0|nr:hypothetical protein [Kurthia massiliensis]
MKFVIFLLTGTLLVAGCQQQQATQVNASYVATPENQDYAKSYPGNPQIPDDRTLLQTGDTIQTEKGFMTLKKANFHQQVIDIGNIRLTIYDTKRIHLEPAYSMIDYFHPLVEAETFDIVKAFVTIENRGTEALKFSPVATITAQKDTQTFERDIYLDHLTGLIQPGEIKQGNIGYIANNEASIWQINTSTVFDENDEKHASHETFTLHF